MLQNVVTDRISTIDSLWSGSQLAIPYIQEVAAEPIYGGNFLVYAILFFICFILLFRRDTALLIKDIVSWVKTPVRYSYQEGGLHKTQRRIYIATYILLPVLAYLVASFQVAPELKYWQMFVTLFLLLIVQFSINSIIEYVSTDTHLAGFLNMSYSIMLIAITIVLFVSKVFILFFHFPQVGILSLLLYIMIGIAVLVYCFNILRIFFSFKTSHLFSFLYLCTLELIPLAIIFKMVSG